MHLYPGVVVRLLPEKFQKLRDDVQNIYGSKGMIQLGLVQKVAGLLSWASGLFPWIRGFNACLWAALAAHAREQATGTACASRISAKKRPTHLFFALRIKPAISWIRMLLTGLIRDCEGQALVLEKWFSLSTRFHAMQLCIRSDTSPFGMGAILHFQGEAISWMALEWSSDDLLMFQASIGDPAWQAEWELYAILLAVDTWLVQLRGEAACLFQADATAALFSAARMAGRTPAMNAVAAEIALRLESAHVHMATEHYEGVLNFHCDALSRLSQGAEIPAVLAAVERCSPKPRSAQFFWAWPRDLLASQSNAAAGRMACGQGA